MEQQPRALISRCNEHASASFSHLLFNALSNVPLVKGVNSIPDCKKGFCQLAIGEGVPFL